jgi:Carboxypeptidase regulatory-like domain/TonB dependent receptor-like, beta-barrel
MRRSVVLTALWILAIPMLFASGAVAQEITTGSISGRAVDSQGLPIPGATVTLTSSQGPQTFTTDQDGRFFAAFLTPGTYDVRVELSGFKPLEQKGVDVRLGQRVELTLPLDVGSLSETVVVEEHTPIVDTSKTTAGFNVDNTALSNLPVGRRFSDSLYLAPGVSSGGQVGSANPSIGGGSGLDNNYIIDGVNVTNAGYGALGSYSIVFGSLGNGVPFDFIQEEQIQTAGFSAEYGQATGGVVNVVTRSGSNRFSGALFGYSRPGDLESSYKLVETVNGTVNVTSMRENDAGAQIGGPLKKDKLFYFAAIDPQWQRTSFVAPAGFPLESLGALNRNRRIISYAAKGTYQIVANHRVDATFFGDPAKGNNGPQRYQALLRNDTAGFSELKKYGGHNQSVKYEGALKSGWLLEGSASRAVNEIVEVPSVNEPSVTDTTVTPNIRSGGIGFFEVGNKGTNWQYQGKATKIIGPHQVRFGVHADDIHYDNETNRTGPTFTLPTGQQTTSGAQIQIIADPTFGRIFRVTRADTNNVRSTKQTYVDVFAQDTWRIGNTLTVMPGVRYEHQRLEGTVEELTFNQSWAPRLGVTYDPSGHGKMKIYGNWGLFYVKLPNDLAARALSIEAGVSRADYFDLALTQPVPDGVLALGTTQHFAALGSSADAIDPDIKSSYLNELLTGFEYAATSDLSVGIRWIRRSMPRIVEDVQPFPIVATDLGIPGASTATYTLTNPNANTPTAGNLGASFEKARHRYDAIEVTLDKRQSNKWSGQASYRYARLRGTFEGFFRDDNGQSDPGITSLFDFPTNDPSYTAIGVPQFGYRGDVRFLGSLGDGPLPLDRRHEVKLFGHYVLPKNFTVGGSFIVSSGKPLTALAANPVYDTPGEIPESVRGAGFQTADGFKRRTPVDAGLAVHGDWSVKLGGPNRLVLLADIFNLFNRQQPLDYDPNTETTFGVLNPDVGQPSRFNLAQLQTPRALRIGVRYEF